MVASQLMQLHSTLMLGSSEHLLIRWLFLGKGLLRFVGIAIVASRRRLFGKEELIGIRYLRFLTVHTFIS